MAVLSGIMEIDTVTYMRIIRDSILGGRNVLVLAPAGSGKTEIASYVINKTPYPMELMKFGDGNSEGRHGDSGFTFRDQYLNLSVCTPPELVGLPEVRDGVAMYNLPPYMPANGRTEGGRKVVMLVDELDKADTDLQNPMLEMFQFKSINGTKLDIQSVVATANMPDEGAFSKPISTALANRCQIFKLKVSANQWTDWAVSAGINPLIVGYINEHPGDLTKKYHKEDNTAYCQPSPRSWTMAARALDTVGTIENGADIDYAFLQVASYVGQNAATGFRDFLQYSHEVTPLMHEIIATGKTKNKPNDGMILVLAIMTVSKLVTKLNENAEKLGPNAKSSDAKDIRAECNTMATNIFNWLAKGSVPMEIALSAMRSSITPQLFMATQMIQIPVVRELYGKINELKKV